MFRGSLRACTTAVSLQVLFEITASRGLNHRRAALTSWFQADVRAAHDPLALDLATVSVCCVLHTEHISNIRSEYIREACCLHSVSLIYSLTYFWAPEHKAEQGEQAGPFQTGQMLYPSHSRRLRASFLSSPSPRVWISASSASMVQV